MNLPSILGSLSLFTAVILSGTAPAQGGGNHGNQAVMTYIQSLPLETIDASERYLLTHMREEEKLARDVYRVLAQSWPMPIFANIAAAEQSHMDLVLFTMQRYQLPDPVPSDQVGVFANPTFTALFQMATNFGQISPLHAMMVGALIEDLDVVDLDAALFYTDNRDVDTVWQNLARGSRNHMRAFYPQLQSLGVTYTGLFLLTAEVLNIVTTPVENRPVDENGVPLF